MVLATHHNNLSTLLGQAFLCCASHNMSARKFTLQKVVSKPRLTQRKVVNRRTQACCGATSAKPQQHQQH